MLSIELRVYHSFDMYPVHLTNYSNNNNNNDNSSNNKLLNDYDF